MKALLLTGLLTLLGCGLFGSDDDNGGEEEPPLIETLFAVQVNGKSWGTGSGSISLSCRGEASLWLGLVGAHVVEQTWPYYEAVEISTPYEGLGTYSLVRTLQNERQSLYSGTHYTEQDGDVAIARYNATEDPEANQLTITRYDPDGGSTESARDYVRDKPLFKTAGIVEGTFRTTVVVRPEDAKAEPGEMRRRQPDTLRFTEGRFRVGVVEVKDAIEECGPVPTGQREE